MKAAPLLLTTLAGLACVTGYSYKSPFSIVTDVTWITCNFDKTLDLNVSQTKVYFYDFENDYNITSNINEAAANITAYENWSPNKRLIVYVTGFNLDVNTISSEWVREAVSRLPNTYLLLVDYIYYANTTLASITVEKTIPYMYYMGNAIAKFLAELHSCGVPSDNIHGVGHSLGGQILGFIGEAYTSYTGEQLGRLTAIDPAKPCFFDGPMRYKISSGKAKYVVVYHCSEDSYGTNITVADADFYYNKFEGQKFIQPGCYDGISIPTIGQLDAEGCGHIYCVQYWSNTVGRPNLYQACSNDEEICTGSTAIAGYYNSGDAFGEFYAFTEHGSLTVDAAVQNK